MPQSSLLGLPAELRLQIYEYIFAAQDRYHNPWHSILLTNKQLHADINDLLKDATLRVRLTPRIFHQALAQNLRLHRLQYTEPEDCPFLRVGHFQTYCKRFHAVLFDITETQGPTDCRLPPSYERKGKELAGLLTAWLTLATTPASGKGPKIDILWGSFSRNVYKGIVTWDCCVLKGFGSLMALPRNNHSELTEIFDCAIVLEERRRRGTLAPPILDHVVLAITEDPQMARRSSLVEKLRLAIQSRR
jgi:hypothetical protein